MNDSIAVVAAKIGKRASGRQFGEPKRTAPADDFIAARPYTRRICAVLNS
jgi:hypothetical protein